MPENDLPLLVNAVHEAGHVALQYWRNSPKMWQKPEMQGPVSEADLAVDALLRDILLRARPNYGWLSEESDQIAPGEGTTRRFIVDPIDGTRAYLQGERTFAHSVAVAEGDRIICAAVHLPLREKLYTAALGAGAQKNDQSISASGITQPDHAEVLANKPVTDPKHWRDGVPTFRREYRPSLAYRMCLVAEGRFDAMISLRNTWHWDIAAGALILQEAGAKVTDGNGAPIAFASQVPQSVGVVAANPGLHSAFAGALR